MSARPVVAQPEPEDTYDLFGTWYNADNHSNIDLQFGEAGKFAFLDFPTPRDGTYTTQPGTYEVYSSASPKRFKLSFPDGYVAYCIFTLDRDPDVLSTRCNDSRDNNPTYPKDFKSSDTDDDDSGYNHFASYVREPGFPDHSVSHDAQWDYYHVCTSTCGDTVECRSSCLEQIGVD